VNDTGSSGFGFSAMGSMSVDRSSAVSGPSKFLGPSAAARSATWGDPPPNAAQPASESAIATAELVLPPDPIHLT
jgi:hypothetical protein